MFVVRRPVDRASALLSLGIARKKQGAEAVGSYATIVSCMARIETYCHLTPFITIQDMHYSLLVGRVAERAAVAAGAC